MDNNGCPGIRAYTISITGCPVIALSPPTLPNGVVGTAYSQTVIASGGTASYTYTVTSGALPTGLSLNTVTGAITGTPTTVGIFNFTITATDNGGCSGSHLYSIVIAEAACPVITLNPPALPSGPIGTPYSQSVIASGGTAPYTYAVSSGDLPTDLLLNAGTGAITGTPTTVGTFNFTITATDSVGCSGSHQYSIVIAAASCPVITLSRPTLPSGLLGTAYSQTVTASGGTAPYTYAVSSGDLPPDLLLNTVTGAITGTPTTAGIFNFTITVTDTGGCPGIRAYTVSITGCPIITLSPPTLPNGLLGTAYNQTVTASGGTAPYTYTVTSGALPTGLSLNAGTGAITGTPMASGVFSFIITATDANGCTGLLGYTVTIVVPTPATDVPTLNEWGAIFFMLLAGLGSVYYLRKYGRV
jgi:hypothetical protein